MFRDASPQVTAPGRRMEYKLTRSFVWAVKALEEGVKDEIKMLVWFVPEFFYWLWFGIISLDAYFYETLDLVGDFYRRTKPWRKG
jgi:hypothetical protein